MRLTTRALRALVPAAVGLLAVAAPSHAAAPPAAPTGFTATFVSGAIDLAWTDASTDETGFVIERCITTTGNCGRIAGVGAGVTTFADTWYTRGDINAYRVYAVNASGASAPSSIASVGLFGVGEATARILTSTTNGQAPLTVAFDGSSSTSLNGPVLTFDWSFGDDGVASGSIVSHTYTIPGTYVARLHITAASLSGVATATTASVLVTVAAPPLPLAAPADLRATSPARGQIRLAWTNPPSSATSLTLQRCSGRTCSTFANVAVVTGASGYTDVVKRSTTYRYRLVASDGTATALSNVVTVTSK